MVPKQVFTWGYFESPPPPTRCQFQRPLLVGLIELYGNYGYEIKLTDQETDNFFRPENKGPTSKRWSQSVEQGNFSVSLQSAQ